MLMKPRFESEELQILRSLHTRMCLSSTETTYYANLKKGLKGEREFDRMMGEHSENRLILNDLLLENNKTIFQIDSLQITQDTIYLFEIKNYEGDYYIEDDRWYTLSGVELKNPLEQLKRSESLLRRLLQDLDLGVTIPIVSYITLINPNFHLYQAPLNTPVIYPAQLNRFISNLCSKTSKLKSKHYNLAEQLASLHLRKSPYTRLPTYSYEQVKKGITCSTCHSFMLVMSGHKIVCTKCSTTENIDNAIIRNVKEIKMLFPKLEITTNLVHDWCEIISSKKAIRRVLRRNYKLVGHGKSSIYIVS